MLFMLQLNGSNSNKGTIDSHMKQFIMLFQRRKLDKLYMLEVVHTTKILLLQNPVQRVTILQ